MERRGGYSISHQCPNNQTPVVHKPVYREEDKEKRRGEEGMREGVVLRVRSGGVRRAL